MSGKTVINSRYELEALPLARGGMGEVWIGRDIKLEREVAVKFIRFPQGHPDEELTRRFVRESRITARLEHPGVPAVYDVGTHDGRPYMVMQRVRGLSVADLVAEHGPLPIGWAAAIAAQVCSVLAVAHQASLVHRDLKPGNLMLDPDGCVKVLDFGLAVALDVAELSQITATGQTLGTPAYMAPEQVLAGMSGPATDLYALGCTLHEMLTGQQVFTGPTAYAVMSKQVDEPPRSASGLRPEVPPELDHLLLELLRKKAEERPSSAAVVYDRLLPFADGLGGLPGVLHPAANPSPVRMYARMLSRVYSHPTGPAVAATENAPVSERRSEASREFSRRDLDRARREAGRLAEESRYSQAAEVISAVLAPATQQFGTLDEDVVSLRLQLADALYEGGDYRQAAPVYHDLAAALADRHGPHAEQVLDCRLREIHCYALTGQTSVALRRLDEVLRQQRQARGEDDLRVLELRKQAGLLRLGAGQRAEAERILEELRDDLTDRYGPAHPMVAEVVQLLSGLGRDPDRGPLR